MKVYVLTDFLHRIVVPCETLESAKREKKAYGRGYDFEIIEAVLINKDGHATIAEDFAL